jgi:iron complex transport system ATP-binding protein
MNTPLPQNPDAPSQILEARGLGHQFHPNWWCLKDIDLEVRVGELVGLAGSNGAGKTTLMRAMSGQLRPSSGAVFLNGRPLRRMDRLEIARRIGYLPQSVRSSFGYTVEEVVAQGRYPHQRALGLLSRIDREAIRRAMQWTHVEAFARRPLEQLSGGERQRVLLASVLAQGGHFLLLDEPTVALDLHHQIDVFERIFELARQGLGVLLITHDLNLAAQYCDRLALLHEGRMVVCGKPERVMRAETLQRVYETDLIVEKNPVTGAPMVVLLGRHGANLADQHQRIPTP